MTMSRRTLLGTTAATTLLGALGLAGCTTSSGASSSASGTTTSTTLTFDAKAWNYDATNDVYWQIGKTYVASPGAKDYETLGIYVPGKYLTATKNSDGTTYTAEVNSSGQVGDYTATTAPIVFPVNTPGYAAQKPPTSYSYDSASSYLKAGFVYVAAGLRGKDSNSDSYTGNAPWGVTDLKAAVRYVRYNTGVLPGDKDRIFVFGHSGGGAQSSVMGASGDAEAYTPYLTSLGAAMTDPSGKTLSDAIAGVMAWCPITSLDYANAAYEWNMGQFASTGTRASGTWTAAYSRDLASAFGEYVNKLGLRDAVGASLSLAKSGTGLYLSGSYYDHVVSVLTTSQQLPGRHHVPVHAVQQPDGEHGRGARRVRWSAVRRHRRHAQRRARRRESQRGTRRCADRRSGRRTGRHGGVHVVDDLRHGAGLHRLAQQRRRLGEL